MMNEQSKKIDLARSDRRIAELRLAAAEKFCAASAEDPMFREQAYEDRAKALAEVERCQAEVDACE